VEVPVATGEHVGHRAVALSQTDDEDYGPGAALMASGRVSMAREIKPLPPTVPFTTAQLARLDEALTLASRATGLDFSIYLGDLGADSRTKAEALHASVGPDSATNSVLIAVSPGQRVVEVVTGDEAYRRLSDRACKLSVMSMVASFKEGDLTGGLISALRMLTDQAGSAPRHTGPVGPASSAH
jgi:uncharacterized membrane protein